MDGLARKDKIMGKVLTVFPSNDVPNEGYCVWEVGYEGDWQHEFRLPSPVSSQEELIDLIQKELPNCRYLGGRQWEQVED